ncbi:hypothetical protein GCM10008927_27290 [Amylibacter ulvae]|uniref:Uncharacterized protein n=1 Tax=Paramylibacter ulvae TaxID=1651968 RepID=A0ABQ3D6F9_9RHOB|nr:hypothetical protein GCM10008927_27290 [Amylibacter ulvae]
MLNNTHSITYVTISVKLQQLNQNGFLGRFPKYVKLQYIAVNKHILDDV